VVVLGRTRRRAAVMKGRRDDGIIVKEDYVSPVYGEGGEEGKEEGRKGGRRLRIRIRGWSCILLPVAPPPPRAKSSRRRAKSVHL